MEIQLKKDNILRIAIKDSNGVDTGEHLEFDMEDVEYPLRINKCEIEHKKNVEYLKGQFLLIEKKPDHKGKYLLSSQEEEKLRVLKEFYNREMDAFDLFIGKGGSKKLLNGRSPYYTMYDDFKEMLEPIIPLLEENVKSINDKIRNKYSKTDNNVLKDE